MSNKKFVTYLEFGAVGDGVTNDFAAIKRHTIMQTSIISPSKSRERIPIISVITK